jgi:adenylylsulfate kinase
MNDIKSGGSKNVVWHHACVTRAEREKRNNHKSLIIWFTGLSNSGKSTIAHALEEKLFEMGCCTFVFDGDNVRHGLCGDLGFSREDRTENIRRIGEMAKLFVEAGLIAVTAFISPFRSERERVRSLVGDGNFVEVYCKCPIEICEKRDVKGHYRRARAGEIKEFTGVSSPYEEPENPDLILDTSCNTVEECVRAVVGLLIERAVVEAPLPAGNRQ